MRQRVDGLRREQKLDKVRVAARVQFAMAQHGVASCASALFLGESRPMRTFWAKPFRSRAWPAYLYTERKNCS